MSSSSDFDFLIGDWSVFHRRLKHRLASSTEWEEFPGTTSCRKILGGAGNSDDNHLELPGDPYDAMTVRTFDSRSGEWSIWWFDGRRPTSLDPPVKGRFVEGVGTFLAHDTFQGVPIVVRFDWDARDPTTPRWEQAFSNDDGASWEVNWTMVFSRLD
jgi:hypothetical protein